MELLTEMLTIATREGNLDMQRLIIAAMQDQTKNAEICRMWQAGDKDGVLRAIYGKKNLIEVHEPSLNGATNGNGKH